MSQIYIDGIEVNSDKGWQESKYKGKTMCFSLIASFELDNLSDDNEAHTEIKDQVTKGLPEFLDYSNRKFSNSHGCEFDVLHTHSFQCGKLGILHFLYIGDELPSHTLA
ncbi:hypothetical protein [Stutzerimonas xanthomarina]|uniref:hypothetical protein n=1 Tax=Stutzerimonas xanthomarina TaxID=271420 RepID=UPI003AA9E11E